MAFDPSDLRNWMGDTVHLFIFRRQGITLRYASSTRDVVIGEHTYQAAQIERAAIRQTAERAKDKLKIRIAYSVASTEPPDGWSSTQALGNWWRPHIPSDPITVICMSCDPGSADPPRVEWTGWVMPSAFDDAQMELTCDPKPPAGSAGNQGSKFQRQCFKTVYSTGPRGCNLIPGPIIAAAELSAVDGSDITAAALDTGDAWIRVEWMDVATPRSANVIAQAGGTLTLDDVTGLAVDSLVTAYTTNQFTIDGELTAVDGLKLTAAEFIGTPFSLVHGWLTWTRDDGIVEERPIMAHNNSTGEVTILWGGADIEIGTAVAATPNCPGTWAACAARRDDPQNHYGGAIYKPVKDPITEGIPMSWS